MIIIVQFKYIQDHFGLEGVVNLNKDLIVHFQLLIRLNYPNYNPQLKLNCFNFRLNLKLVLIEFFFNFLFLHSLSEMY
jgi:hypothetical protein